MERERLKPQELLELVANGDFDGFEARCLELLAAGALPLAELAGCLRHVEAAGQAERIPPLAQMVLENADLEADADAALSVARVALNAAPDNSSLRQAALTLFQRVHGEAPGFAAILESSGLAGGAAARTALRVLEFCLSLRAGDTLISRMDGRVVEVTEMDRERALFTLRRGDRATTIPARELVREYERIDPDDFRVLRQVRPERLTELIQRDPVALVIGLIHAHGEHIDADQLKHELVPRYIDAAEWSKWWNKARTLLKRSPHVVIEGRAPVVLSYSAAGVSLEEESWSGFAAQKDAAGWLGAVESYLREQKARRQPPDPTLLNRFRDHIEQHAVAARARRPGEALAAALVLGRLAEQGVPVGEPSQRLAVELLREAAEPVGLFAALRDDVLWERALASLPAARPADWPACVAALIGSARATQLDALVQMARQGGRLDAVQQCLDDALVDPIDYAEVIYWLWKGPADAAGLRLPGDSELFHATLDTLGALGVTLVPAAEVARHFKSRVKAALGLREYARVRACVQQLSLAAAVPLRRRLERTDALGPVVRSALLEILRSAHPQLWVTREVKLAPWEDPQVVWATAAGLQRKTAERDEVVNVRMPENARRIGEAAAHGDLSENSEYRFALEERDLLRARLAQINRELSLARVLASHDVPADRVGIGSRVTLRNPADGSLRVMTILGPFEADVERGIYSYQAPVCQRLMALRVGERALLTIDGSEREFELVGLESAIHGEGA